jgi:hypothetical protein
MLGEQSSGMTGLTLRSSKRGMSRTACSGREVRPSSPVGLHHEVLSPEFGVTLGAVPDVMTLITGLRIIQRLDGMDLLKIRTMGLGNIVRPVVRNAQVRIYAAAFVAVEAELLVMTVRAVPAGPSSEEAVLPHLIGPVGRRNA